jgi:hypothetical protein
MNLAPGKCTARTALKTLSVTTVWALAVFGGMFDMANRFRLSWDGMSIASIVFVRQRGRAIVNGTCQATLSRNK